MRGSGEIERRLHTRPAGTPPSHVGWNSPIPYLFGGLAAMLGLVGFALLILACSYWKVSSSLNGQRSVHGDQEKGETPAVKKPTSLETKVVVIMAGDANPTYLATPVDAHPFTIVVDDNDLVTKARVGDDQEHGGC